VTFESAHKRLRDAREKYHRLTSELSVARAQLNAAERDVSVEWRKVLDDAHARAASKLSSDQRG
jgi:hypothetical protein